MRQKTNINQSIFFEKVIQQPQNYIFYHKHANPTSFGLESTGVSGINCAFYYKKDKRKRHLSNLMQNLMFIFGF
ncbi:MAG: hypothetical protein EAZ57_04790 [Cytophagales bacterium]|nr:MAG: hypothetical protein EAZ67_01090 [Cytophagales bacterium]TAF61110.1 MAG: hypothetical protein EAZ57_04790 [Cytophagales bacterium]